MADAKLEEEAAILQNLSDLDNKSDNPNNSKNQRGSEFELGPSLNTEEDFTYHFSRKTQPNLMTGIYGMSGSGKTGVTKIIIEEAVKNNIPSIVLSPASDFYTLLELHSDNSKAKLMEENKIVLPLSFSDTNQVPIHFPLFNLPSKEEVNKHGISNADLELTFEKIASAYVNIAHSTESKNRIKQFMIFFTQLIKEAYEREFIFTSIDDFQQLIVSDLSLSILRRLGLDRLKRNLTLGIEAIKTGQTKYLFDLGWSLNFDSFLSKINNKTPVNILDINEFNVEDQNKIVGTFCDLILNWGISKGLTKEIRTIVIIDEAHNYCPKGNKITAGKRPIERLVREGRKYGLVCILSTQLPRDLDAGVRANLGIVCLGKSIRDEVKEVHKDICARTEIELDIDQLYSLESREFVWADSRNVKFFRSRDLYTKFDKINESLVTESSEDVKKYLPELDGPSQKFTLDFSKLKGEAFDDEISIQEIKTEHNIETLYLKSSMNIDIEEKLENAIGDQNSEVTIEKNMIMYLPYLLGHTNVKINSQPKYESGNNTLQPFPNKIFDVFLLEGLLKILNMDVLDDALIEDLPAELWILNTQLSELSHYSKEAKSTIMDNLDRKLPRSIEFDPEGISEVLNSESLQKSLINSELRLQVDEFIATKLTGRQTTKHRQSSKTQDRNVLLKRQLVNKLNEYKSATGGVNKSVIVIQYNAVMKKTVEWKRKVEKLKSAGKYDSYYKDVTKKRLDEFDSVKRKLNRIEQLEREINDLKAQINNPSQSSSTSSKNKADRKELSTFLEELDDWRPDESDSINQLDFNIVYVPFQFLIGSYNDEFKLIAMMEIFRGSDIYISCIYCLERRGINDSQLHRLIWECGINTCSRIMCDHHSEVSQFSSKHLCEEHQGECSQCGIVEPEELEICDNCHEPFCPNHIELISKRFKKDQSLCLNCQK